MIAFPHAFVIVKKSKMRCRQYVTLAAKGISKYPMPTRWSL